MPLNRPSASELIEALKEYYTDRLSATGQQAAVATKFKFHDLVAHNVLSIVQRECLLGRDFDAQEQVLLRALLDDHSNLELPQQTIKRIESGFFDEPEAQQKLLKALREITISKLAIDNPNYPSLGKLQS